MGACYSVWLKAKIKDGRVNEIVEALNNKIATTDGRCVNYGIDRFYPGYESPFTVRQLMEVFFVKHQESFEMDIDDKVIEVNSNFDASYGWESIMIEAVGLIAPWLEDNSKLYIEIDNDYDKFIVKDGKLVVEKE